MREILEQCRQYFIYSGVLSFIMNVLSLTPIIYMINAMDKVVSSHSVETLISITSIAIYVFMLEAMFEFLRAKFLNSFSKTLHHLLGQPTLQSLLTTKQQDVHSRYSMDDVEILQQFITTKGLQALIDAPWIPFYIILLYYFHISLALLAILSIILLIGLAVWEHKTTHFGQLMVGSYARASKDYLRIALLNGEVISALNMRDHIVKRWWVRNEEYLNRKNQVEERIMRIVTWTKFIRSTITTVAMGVAAYFVLQSEVSSGVLLGAMILLPKAIAPISSVISAGKSFTDAQGAYLRLSKILEHNTHQTQQLNLPAPIGQVSVERIFFYLSRDRNILSAVNFQLDEGECLVVLGSNAAGKSTLAKLLVGFYKPNDGFVRLDGADVSVWANNGLGQSIGYLPQEVQLFEGTVAENIARLERVAPNQDKIIAAARQARIEEMILKLPNGYDTQVGEQGGMLSSGQRQRIGIARALYNEPNYIVFDEPDAHLDGQAELEFINLIKELKSKHVTVVIVSHKPNVVKVADKILTLHEGKMQQFGLRQEVLSALKMA